MLQYLCFQCTTILKKIMYGDLYDKIDNAIWDI